MSERKLFGYWDCRSCGTKKIRGTERHCPNCGAPIGDTKCYMDPNHKEYLDEETAKGYGKGANWICPYCGNQNRYYSTHCESCGAAKAESKKDYFGNDPNQENSSQREMASEHDSSYFDRSSVLSREEKSKQDTTSDSDDEEWHSEISSKGFNFSDLGTTLYDFFKNNKRAVLIGVSSVLTVIALIVMLVAIFTPRIYNATVTSNNWERTISIEEYKTVKESDWYVPSGGRVYNTASEYHHTDHILDHYETVTVTKSRQVIDHYDTHVEYSYSDNGDGTFTEHSHTVSEPVYRTEYYTETEEHPVYIDVPRFQTKYYYEIEKWVYNRTEKSSGGSDSEIYWPEYTLADNERTSGKTETYTVIFDTEKKTYKKNVSESELYSLKVGTKVKITVQAGFVTKFEILR